MSKFSRAFFHFCFTLLGVTLAQAECAPGRTGTTVGGQTFCCKPEFFYNVDPPEPFDSCIPEDQPDDPACANVGEFRTQFEIQRKHKSCTTWFCDGSGQVPYEDVKTVTRVQVCSRFMGQNRYTTLCHMTSETTHECRVVRVELCREVGLCGQFVDRPINKYEPIGTSTDANYCGDSFPEAQQQHGAYHSLFTQQQRASINTSSGDLDDADALGAYEANDLVRAFGAVDGGEQGAPTGSGRRSLNSLVRDFGDYDECPPVQP